MPLDPERLAADVIQVIKAALAPVAARVSSVEERIAAIPVPDATLPARLTALEIKADAPLPAPPPPIDLTVALAPVVERVSKMEATLATMPAPEPSADPEHLAASFTGMLTKELDALDTPRTQKRVERDERGNVTRVIEEPVT